MLGFLLAFVCFYYAVRREHGPGRYLLGVVHTIFMAFCLKDTGQDILDLTQYWMPFVVGFTMHTTSIIFIDRLVITRDATTSALQRLRKAIRVWSNVRRLRLVDDTPIRDRPAEQTIFRFVADRLVSLLELVCLTVLAGVAASTMGISSIIIKGLILLNGKLVQDNIVALKDTLERFVVCLSWVWPTYAHLTAAHDLLALLHVAVLRLDSPSEWPPLFGYLAEGYSLRRFWGVSWHKLHVPMFEAWMPSWHDSTYLSRFCCCRLCCPLDAQDQGQTNSPGEGPSSRNLTRKSFRSLWMFFMSAMCFSLVDLAAFGWGGKHLSQNLFFFLANWALCTTETVVGHLISQYLPVISLPMFFRVFVRLLGYMWVWYNLLGLVSIWQLQRTLLPVDQRTEYSLAKLETFL